MTIILVCIASFVAGWMFAGGRHCPERKQPRYDWAKVSGPKFKIKGKELRDKVYSLWRREKITEERVEKND